MSQASDFKNFLHNKVNLNQTRLNSLGKRVAALETYLGNDEVFGEYVTELLPQGSFAHGTIIKPVGNRDFDADVLMPMDHVEGWQAEDYVSNLHRAFGRSSTYKGMRVLGKRCVTINYAGDFHVDVVPYVHRNGTTYITNRQTNEFQWTEPDDFTAWLEKQNRITNGNLVKVVRLLKYLRDHKGTYRVPSVTLTAALAHEVDEYAKILNPDAYKGVANTLGTLSNSLARRMSGHVLRPPHINDPGTGQNLADRWKDENYAAFRDRFTRHAKLIETALGEDDYSEALKIWRDLFGADFGQAHPLTKTIEAAASTGHAPASERFLDTTYGIKDRLNPAYHVRMVGEVVPKRGYSRRPLPKTGDLVFKNREIVFRIRENNVPHPHKVYWKIRNHGDEAAQANCLRGDIHEDDGSQSRRESTAYVGHHYVEVYIVKDGFCVAKSRQPVIVVDS